ncbi:restriction endonuclease subunit S [Spirosoma litoris]
MEQELVESGIEWQGVVPINWRKSKLRRLCTQIGSGGTPSSGNEAYYDGDIFWVQSGDLNDSYISDTSKKLSEEGYKNSSAKYFPKGSLLIALYGATIGKLGILEMDATTNQACCALVMSDRIETKFMFYSALDMRQYLISQAYGGGQANISQDIVKHQYLYFPPKSEQAAIAAHLDRVCERIDKAIALKQKQVKKLEKVWRTRLHEAVTKGLYSDVLKQPGNDSYLGDVPIHWKVDRIKDVATFNPSKPIIEPDEDIALVPMDCVSENGRVSIAGQVAYRDVDKGLNYFQAGDVLFAKITPCMENGKGAFVTELPTRYAFGSTEFFVIRPKPCILGKYLYYATRTKLFREYAELNMKGAAGQQRVTAKFLTTCKIAFPRDIKEQQQIVDYLDDFRKKTTQIKARMIRQTSVLQDYRRSIIHEYVTGKKRVAEYSITN